MMMTSIKDERVRQSMTQKRLAFESGIDARTLRKIEKGEAVSPESMRAVRVALGLPTRTTTVARSSLLPDVGLASVADRYGFLFLGLLTVCLVATLIGNAYAPMVGQYIAVLGLAVLCAGIVVSDAVDRSFGSGLTGGLLFTLSLVWGIALYWNGTTYGPANGYEVTKTGMAVGLLLAIPRLRNYLVSKTSTGYDMSRLLLAIGTIWLAVWVCDGISWNLSMLKVLVGMWPNPDYTPSTIWVLAVLWVSPMSIGASLVLVAVKRTRTIGLIATLATSAYAAEYYIAKDYQFATVLWQIEHGVSPRVLDVLVSRFPHIGMAAICVYELRDHVAKLWRRARSMAVLRISRFS